VIRVVVVGLDCKVVDVARLVEVVDSVVVEGVSVVESVRVGVVLVTVVGVVVVV
jgi:hypothetical protein